MFSQPLKREQIHLHLVYKSVFRTQKYLRKSSIKSAWMGCKYYSLVEEIVSPSFSLNMLGENKVILAANP